MAQPKTAFGRRSAHAGYLPRLCPVQELPALQAEIARLDGVMDEAAATGRYSGVTDFAFAQRAELRTELRFSQAFYDDEAEAERISLIRSSPQPGESAFDSLRRRLRNAALEPDWSPEAEQGLAPHPLLVALLQEDPLTLWPLLQELHVAFWLSPLGRYWREHRDHSDREQRFAAPWLGVLPSTWAKAMQDAIPSALGDSLHPGWAQKPAAITALLSYSFLNPGYRLTIRDALAIPHAFHYSDATDSLFYDVGWHNDWTHAADTARHGGIQLDPLSWPEWFAPARGALWKRRRGPRRKRVNDPGSSPGIPGEVQPSDLTTPISVTADFLRWGFHMNKFAEGLAQRTHTLKGPSKSNLQRATPGPLLLEAALFPETYYAVPGRRPKGRPKGSGDKKPRTRRQTGPAQQTPEAIARYEAKQRQRDLRAREAETMKGLRAEAKATGASLRELVRLAQLDGRLPKPRGQHPTRPITRDQFLSKTLREPQEGQEGQEGSKRWTPRVLLRNRLYAAAEAHWEPSQVPGGALGGAQGETRGEIPGDTRGGIPVAPHPAVVVLLEHLASGLPKAAADVEAVCGVRDAGFRHVHGGRGIGGRWLAGETIGSLGAATGGPGATHDPQWASKAAERWFPALGQAEGSGEGSRRLLLPSESTDALCPALPEGADPAGPLGRLVAAWTELDLIRQVLLDPFRAEMQGIDREQWTDDQTGEPLDDDALMDRADALEDQLIALRDQAEQELDQGLGAERELFTRYLARYHWLEPAYAWQLKAALDAAYEARTLKAGVRRTPEARLPEGFGA